ncbi:ATP-binding cassette domain-containing protein [Desulfurispirillum indicum]|uniref:Cell division ATP-binding protein FtsE n=1 Tax=Desulfurispirillum indicum (strain ATCC BAA-1389 / DSM 22839 / S5) TaxID=653733 RepID=E6W5K9_DESIS|nr:ATP-binding cassette domain-containing protein [Desulfurispirillum indicum]ADU66040.1 ABC transporter related protein [Desulfurispirillum indicum S5]UCZ57978.1 ATP-binding cassette domain-containing protein [Desulfurispirillum indicum]
MIQFYNVTKSYGDHFELSGVNIRIAKGQFCFLCGPSGAGKTTIINLILGEEHPNQGSVLVNRRNVPDLRGNELARHRRDVGVVFQDYRLIERLNVYDNIALALHICGFTARREIDRRVEAVCKMLGLVKYIHAPVMQLSGGEKQRVAIARALIHNPPVIIADEPTGNLDMKQSIDIFRIFRKICDMGTTVFFATHDNHLVEGSGIPVYRVDNGMISYDVSP